MSRRSAVVAAVAALALVFAWLLFVALPRWYGANPAQASSAAPSTSGRGSAPAASAT
jgi:hypothetical protein